MKRSALFLVLTLAVAMAFLFTDDTHAQRPPLVLAFYYNWFDESTWSPSKVPDMPATRYVSRDAGAMARQIRQARDAGIDAFVVSWWGAGNPTDENFKTMLGQASAANFRLAVDFELTSPFYRSKNDVIRSLRNLLATHVNHPAYLRSDGKPVIFFWREQKYSVDEWRDIRNQVDPNHQSLWIAEGVKEQLPYLSVFDGFHLYSIAWAADVASELQKWSPRVHAYGDDKIWVATTMPGNDDTRSHRADSYVRDRRGGEFYRETWRAAFSTSPDWIIITSWNEWVEGTMIEPSVSYGNLYLDITRGFAAQFKAGLPAPTPAPTKTPMPSAIATPTIKPTVAPTRAKILPGTRAIISETVHVRAAPNTKAEILGYAFEGASITLLRQSDDGLWWQIPYPAGELRGWVHSDYIDLEAAQDSLILLNSKPTPTFTPTIEPTSTSEPTEIIEPDTPTPTPTAAHTATPTPGFSFPSLKNIFPFLP